MDFVGKPREVHVSPVWNSLPARVPNETPLGRLDFWKRATVRQELGSPEPWQVICACDVPRDTPRTSRRYGQPEVPAEVGCPGPCRGLRAARGSFAKITTESRETGVVYP